MERNHVCNKPLLPREDFDQIIAVFAMRHPAGLFVKQAIAKNNATAQIATNVDEWGCLYGKFFCRDLLRLQP
jgi:hypothetical protein